MFITFEGVDGSGKSTQVVLLQQRLEDLRLPVYMLREPGGTDVSERIREVLLHGRSHISAFAELLLFSAARAHLVDTVIKPALSEGVIVVCDRFYDSTTAYQGAGRGAADLAWIREFNMRVTGGLVPDRTYLLEVPPSVARDRMHLKEPDRMEMADDAFYTRVAETYDMLAKEEASRFVRIDAWKSAQDIHETIWNDLILRLDFPDSPQ